MAEDQEDKTEISGRQLARAWEEGRIPLGHDLPIVASLAAGAGALVVLGGALRSGLVQAIREAMASVDTAPYRMLPHLALRPAGAVAAVCGIVALGSTLVTLVQTRGGFWADRWAPDFSRLFDPSRLTRLLSKDVYVDLGLAVVKVVTLGWAAWTSVRGDFLTLGSMLTAGSGDQLARTVQILLRAGWRMLLVGAVLAGLELALTRSRFMRSVRVTKTEAKHEAREEEGDPLIKGKRKKRHREISRSRARVEVPRADALLVNPTHIAIALRYRRDEGRAPRVIAKGKGALAEYMRDIARENAIPIVEDIPLARLLYRKVKVGQEVPASTYKAVAAVLAFVYRVTGRAPAGPGAAA